MLVDQQSLIEFGYISRAKNRFSNLELIQLFDKAFNFNTANGITGVLFYENRYFAQILEGTREDISRLWKQIQNDNRHVIIREIGFREIDQRTFPSWGMRFFGADRIAKHVPNLKQHLNGLPGSDSKLLTLMRSVAALDRSQ
ncbi:BLUF domain-containing protein [Polynucleobacter sp. MWH-UH35A]|uniref:BLUF domain-containing protein n=1 Tax=Polynucleobacter sp. MWH-UH35A TaxID=1855619 RepID=UPI001BFE558A|nr:BLUF domain-containing protein [Polynucleobacter sp. MWH-UH35A]QWD59511.1 BLUF domain-containing protein [Polynucleobacter sp. MWH-UH35A]